MCNECSLEVLLHLVNDGNWVEVLGFCLGGIGAKDLENLFDRRLVKTDFIEREEPGKIERARDGVLMVLLEQFGQTP